MKIWLFAMFALLVASPAAAEHPLHANCHAYSDSELTISQASQNLQWNCTDQGWQDGRRVTWLRFDDWEDKGTPSVFSSRITVFENIQVAVIAQDGEVRQETYGIDQARPLKTGPIFTMALPEMDKPVQSVIIGIVGAHSVTVATEAHIQADAAIAVSSLTQILLVAMVLGMLIMPLLFDVMFFMVLREKFVFLHGAMTMAMLAYVLTSGGIISAFVTLPVSTLGILAPLSWAFGVGLSGHFMVAFLERDALSDGMRRTMSMCSWWVMLVPGFCALQLQATQAFDNRLYFYAFAPIIPFYVIALWTALKRGSRAAKFLALAWLPVILASSDRFLRGIGVYAAPDSIDQAMFLAIAIEVIVVALAIADRFFAIRQERDIAKIKAESLKRMTERDPLTGMLNRRALKGRFGELREQGFTTLAILDLDDFKSLNDKFGHVIGDAVLESVANALRSDDDTLAVRLGGEEFALLLRGADATERAEQRREAIPRIVAQEVGLDRLVTASMGVISAPVEAMPKAKFSELYRRTDKLLYEAKAAGRNRTMSECLQVFTSRPQLVSRNDNLVA